MPPSPVPVVATGDTGLSTIDRDGDGVTADVDCDDTHAGTYPGAQIGLRICRLDATLRDRNCDGYIDWHEDFDGDGFSHCELDCDDGDADAYPGAPDPLDGVDTNCDGTDGVGEVPVRIQQGRQLNVGLGRRVHGEDVTGDGCADLIVSESGLTISVPSSYAAYPGWVNVYVGCSPVVDVREFEDFTDAASNGIGEHVDVLRTEDGPVLVSTSSFGVVSKGGVEMIDFTVDPPAWVGEYEGVAQVMSPADGVIVHREVPELVVTEYYINRSVGGFAFSEPHLGSFDITTPSRLWYPPVDGLLVGMHLESFDRTGDGYEELLTQSSFPADPELETGIFYVMTEPGVDVAREKWHGVSEIGGTGFGTAFGALSFGAPDLPNPGDRGLLVGSLSLHDSGALYVLPPVLPGEYTLADTSYRFEGEQTNEMFGWDAVVGDVNDDGIADVVVGAPFSEWYMEEFIGPPGKVYVFLGPFSGDVLSRSDARVFVGTQPNEMFGMSVGLADLDGDGVPEIYAGAPGHEHLDGTPGFEDGALYRLDL